MSIKNSFKNKTILYFTFGISMVGILLILGASVFIFLSLKSTPPDILVYLLNSKFNNPYDLVYGIFFLGIIFAISGLILLIYISYAKSHNLNIIQLNKKS